MRRPGLGKVEHRPGGEPQQDIQAAEAAAGLHHQHPAPPAGQPPGDTGAEGRLNYTKMNVLVQSAQAMLAQANQQPQSVLQLLQ